MFKYLFSSIYPATFAPLRGGGNLYTGDKYGDFSAINLLGICLDVIGHHLLSYFYFRLFSRSILFLSYTISLFTYKKTTAFQLQLFICVP